MADVFKNIPVNLIDRADDNLRESYDGIEDLAASIEAVGLIEPIRLTKVGDRYKILAGHRRFEAITFLGWKEVKSVVQSGKIDDADRKSIMLIENMQRVDLTPAEQAKGIFALASEHGMSVADIASTLGVSRNWVKDRISIYSLPDAVRTAVGTDEGLSVFHASHLAELPADRQDRLLKDGKKPSPYDIETQVNKVLSEKNADTLMRKLKKGGFIATTEKELKRIMAAEVGDCLGDDMLVKTMLADATSIQVDYWKKASTTQVKLDRVFRLDIDKADKSTLYVQRRVGGFTEWAEASLVPPEGSERQDDDKLDVYDEIDERNDKLERDYNLNRRIAELEFVASTKPADIVASILWNHIFSITTGYQSWKRSAEACDRLDLEHAEFDDGAITVDEQQQRHAIHMETIAKYARKNSANLARAAATVDMTGRHSFEVAYPDPPKYEDYPEEEEALTPLETGV